MADGISLPERPQTAEIAAKVRRPIYARRSAHTRRIPCFWLTAFENCEELAGRITDADAEALRHLEDVDVEDFADGALDKLFVC